MKLRRIEVENYGLFSGQSFEFESDFTLVFGPNEAGKSTLLQLIREQLFGFKPQNPYSFTSHSGEMAATAELELSDGQRLRFRRRKGNKNVVVGQFDPSGRKIDASGLRALLGGATKELYEHVFGFSLQELTDGQLSLEHANLSEALYGGGVGSLANFQQIQADLKEEADALFSERGSTKVVHTLLRGIKNQRAELRKQAIKPGDYEQLVAEYQAAQSKAGELRGRLDDTRRRDAHLERLSRAIRPWRTSQRAREELATLTVPNGFPADGEQQYVGLKARHDEFTVELSATEEELREATAERDALQLAPRLIEEEATIRQLEQQIKQIEGYRKDLPHRQAEAEVIKSDVLAALRELHPAWGTSHLEQFRSTIAQRELIEQLKADAEDIEQQRTSLVVQQRNTEADISILQRQLAQTVATEGPRQLATLLARAGQYLRDEEKSEDLDNEIEDLRVRGRSIAAKLAAPLDAAIDEEASLPLPMRATIVEFRERMQRASDAVFEVERRADETSRELDEKRDQLAKLDSRSKVPDRKQLLAQRQRRDEGWRTLRQQVREGAALDESLTDEYEQSVREADRIADERQEKAEQAAIRDQLTVEVIRLEQRLAGHHARQTDAEEKLSQEARNWTAAWSGCPFQPLSPDAMLEWSRGYDELRETRTESAALRGKREKLQASVAEFETRLAAEFPGCEEAADQLLARAEKMLEAAREAAVRRQMYEEQLPQRQETLRTLQEQTVELDKRQQSWQERWHSALDDAAFPRDWSVQVTSKAVRALVEARAESEKAADLDKRVADMAGEISEFESNVSELCAAIAPDLLSFVAEHAMSELHSQLENAKRSQHDHERLTKSIAKLESRFEAKRKQVQQAETDLHKLMRLAGATTESQLLEAAAMARRNAELVQQRREADNEVRTICGVDFEADFAAELQQADPKLLAAEQRDLKEALTTAESNFDEAFKAATLLEDRRKQLDGDSKTAELAQDLENNRSKLGTAIHRWAPLVLAQALMKRAIDKFEREHQPAVMADVGRLLQQMTLGRYVAIERKLDEQGTLLVVDESGDRKTPRQLSTGTREQLYLAIRLAYIQHYCHDAEPLPIVMDDVLVNFDAERARQTLRVVAETASNIQTIFLTCHEHMVGLAQEVLPCSTPLILPGGSLPTDVLTAARMVPQQVPK